MKVAEDQNYGWLLQEFIPHREDVLLEDIEIFKDYYVPFRTWKRVKQG